MDVESPMLIIIAFNAGLGETDFTPTMRLGFYKTLSELDNKVKDDNFVILSAFSLLTLSVSLGDKSKKKSEEEAGIASTKPTEV